MRTLKIMRMVKRVWIRRRWIGRKMVNWVIVHFWALPKRKYFSWKAKRAVRVLMGLDTIMVKAEWNRTKRRQFWRDFMTHAKIRGEVLGRMEKEMGGGV